MRHDRLLYDKIVTNQKFFHFRFFLFLLGKWLWKTNISYQSSSLTRQGIGVSKDREESSSGEEYIQSGETWVSSTLYVSLGISETTFLARCRMHWFSFICLSRLTAISSSRQVPSARKHPPRERMFRYLNRLAIRWSRESILCVSDAVLVPQN